MFCPPALAARIDRAEGRFCALFAQEDRGRELGPVALPIGGGVAVYSGPDAPSNKMIGVGFDGPLDATELERVEAAFSTRKARLQGEISTLADPSVHGTLTARGYVPKGFENVLAHSLQNVGPLPQGVSVEKADLADKEQIAEVMVEAFANPDVGGVGGDAIPPSDVIRRWFLTTLRLQGVQAYVARADGAIAGAGVMRLDAGVAQFMGGGTLPRFRRRGIQTALYRTRLADAARSGCDVGVVITQPASKSQANAQREGFHLLYARQLIVKEF